MKVAIDKKVVETDGEWEGSRKELLKIGIGNAIYKST